jgi:hypothetical protein
MRYDPEKGMILNEAPVSPMQKVGETQDEFFRRRHEERERVNRWDQGCAVPVVRQFDTGANRDVDHDKLDYEGFLDPDVLERFARYMHKNRFLRDGSVRDSDNWQKGIPLPVYMKSLWRHFMDLWRAHRGKVQFDHPDKLRDFIEEACCAIMFNVMGYLSQVLKQK